MAQLTLESLRSAGAFTGGLVEKKVAITLESGEEVEFTTWIRPLSYYDAAQQVRISNEDDILARRICSAVCDEEGAPVFRLSDVTGYNEDGAPIMVKDPKTKKDVERGGLGRDVVFALALAINEVSGLGKQEATKKETLPSAEK